MKNILMGMVANVLIFSSVFGSERVNSISELGNPDYIYEFAMYTTPIIQHNFSKILIRS